MVVTRKNNVLCSANYGSQLDNNMGGIRKYYGSGLYKSIYFIRQQTTWNGHLKCLFGIIKMHTKY